MEKTITRKGKLATHTDDNYVPGTAEERIGMVWQITREIVSLSPYHNAERRLQRHITSFKQRTR